MDFTLSEEQQMLSQTVTDMFGESCTGADLRRLLESGEALDPSRWTGIVELGLPAMLAPESLGGVGLGALDMALVATACGYAALPEPLVETAGVAVPVLAAAAPQAIGQVLAGESIAVAHGSNPFVADADQADAILIIEDDRVSLVPRADVRLTRHESIDPFRRLFAVDWPKDAAAQIAEGAAARALGNAAFERGALFAAAQLLGIAQRAVDMSVAYSAERQQFGKPIGSFQAVKHHLATAQVKIEFARPVIFAAAAMLDRGSALVPARVSHAKLAASAAADIATHAAVQVHGAMGYSWEVDVHFLLKRSLGLSTAWGTPAHHRARIAAHVRNAPLGPDRTFGSAAHAMADKEVIFEPA